MSLIVVGHGAFAFESVARIATSYFGVKPSFAKKHLQYPCSRFGRNPAALACAQTAVLAACFD
jgi:hypothetical protein